MIYQITLTYNSTNEVLTLNPDNWSKQGVNMFRHEVYHGFMRKKYITSFRFPIKTGGGGQYILDAYEDGGLEAEIGIEIRKHDPQTDAFTNPRTGILDLKPEKFIIDYEDLFVECSVIDSMKQNKLITRDQINYDVFSLVSSDNVTVADFSTPYQEIDYLPIDIYLDNEFTGGITGSGTLTTIADDQEVEFTGGNVIVNQVGDRLNVDNGVISKLIYTNSTSNSVDVKISNFEFTSAMNITINTGTNNPTVLYVVTKLEARNSGGSLLDYIWIDYYVDGSDQFNYASPPDVLPKNEVIIHTQNDIEYYRKVATFGIPDIFEDIDKDNAILTVPVDGYIELTTQIYNRYPSGTTDVTYSLATVISNLTITEITAGEPQTTVRGLFVHEAFTRLIQLATSETDTSKLYQSDLTGRTDSEFTATAVNGDAAHDFVTNGKLIRGYPDQPLNLNFRDLFKTEDGLRNIGAAYDSTNERFYIDKKENFYNTNLLFDLGEVAHLKVTPYSKAYFSKILSGQKNKVEVEELNGANEYNVSTEHSLSMPIKETLDIQTPYNINSIEQEKLRRSQYDENASIDLNQDKNVYIVDTDGSETIQNGSSVTGFSGSDTYYNIAFSPRECIIRWSNWISAGLYRSANKIINYVTSQKDTNISYTNEGGVSVNEHDDIPDAEMLSPVILPELDEFEKPVSEDILNTLEGDPHGVITYSYDGQNRAVFLLSLETEDYTKAGTWKGISVSYSAVVTDSAIFENGNTIQFENGNNLLWSS